jgi:PIN domain nuclease of toxin-antitoxin system
MLKKERYLMGDFRILLDTCVWIWLLHNSERIVGTSCLKPIFEAAAHNRLYLSAISLWEVAMLAEKERLTLGPDVRSFLKTAKEKSRVNIIPIDDRVAIEAPLLRDLHGDPADRFIVASAQVHSAIVVTADKKILEYAANGGLVAMDLNGEIHGKKKGTRTSR